MTDSSIYYPEQLSGKLLDAFLAKGWYRMFQSIFTTHYIAEQERLYRVFWLRYSLPLLNPSKAHQRLMKNKERFATIIRPATVTNEIEELYALYKSTLSFNPSSSVQHWLYGEQDTNIFDTFMVELREHSKLIAAGIFDNAENSIAGIMNFYHPDYRKFSLGKYLMLLKIEYAKSMGKQWYYPGYIIHGYPRFDYKLFAGKDAAEIYVPELKRWCKYHPSLPAAVEEGRIPGDRKLSRDG